MKLEMTRGCIYDSLSIDGTQEIDLTDEQRKEVIKKVFDSMEPEDLNHLLQWYLPYKGDYDSDDESCESCGDFIESFSLEI